MGFRHRRTAICIAACLVGLSATACNMFAPSVGQQTLEAEHRNAGTRIAQVRGTATVETDRQDATLSVALTNVGRVEIQTTRIAATMLALGTPFIDIRVITPMAPTPAAGAPAAPAGAGVVGPDNGSVVQPIIVGTGSAQGNSGLQPTAQPQSATALPLLPDVTAEANPAAAAALLSDITTASAVGGNDCATQSVSSFSTSAAGVYVVAVAQGIGPANVITARWSAGGVEQVFYDWSPSTTVNGGCIWFYMPAGDAVFTPGTWSVSLEVDGVPVGTPVTFTFE
jgi:hypothetical protein